MSKFSIGSLLEPLGDIVSGAAKTIVPTIGSVVKGIGSSVTSKSGGSLLDGIISSGKSILSSVTSGGGLFKNIGSSISNLFKGNGTSQKGLISGLVSNISKGISSAVSSIGNLFNGNKSGSTSGLLGGGLLSGIGSLFSGLKDKIGGVQNTVLNSSGQTKVDTNELGRLKDALSSFTNKIGSSFDSYKSNFDNLGMSGSGLEGIFSNAKSKIDELIQNKDNFSTTMNSKLNGIIEKVFNIDKSANNTDGNNNAIGNLSEKIPKLNLGEKLSFDKLNFSGKHNGSGVAGAVDDLGNSFFNSPFGKKKRYVDNSKWNSGQQCLSWARTVFSDQWGSGTLTLGAASAKDAYYTLENQGKLSTNISGTGAVLKPSGGGGNGHAMVVFEDKGETVICSEANWGGNGEPPRNKEYNKQQLIDAGYKFVAA